MLPTGYIYPRQDRPVRDLLRRRTLLVRYRTSLKQSLQNLVVRQTGRSRGWRKVRALNDEARAELLGDQDGLPFVAGQPVELIERLEERIKRFEQKVLEPTRLRPAYECLLTMPGVGVILGLTILLETGDLGRFERVGGLPVLLPRRTGAAPVERQERQRVPVLGVRRGGAPCDPLLPSGLEVLRQEGRQTPRRSGDPGLGCSGDQGGLLQAATPGVVRSGEGLGLTAVPEPSRFAGSEFIALEPPAGIQPCTSRGTGEPDRDG